MESLGQLAGGVAHDFNNMLSAIMGYADLAQRELEGEPAVQEDIRQVLEASQRAEHLTRQLLAFSRRQVLEPEVVDLNEIMEDVAGMLGRVIGEQIELSLERAGEPVPTYVDPGGVEQVATNLVLNARDAMPEGGRIVLSTARTEVQETVTCEVGKMPPGEYARLTVSDTGAGMDEHTRSHMFEPFFTTREDGTGLGLATVYGTVRQSGGYLCVDSAVGEGSTFHIFLRLADESVTRDEPEQKERPHADGEETVLVVDDEEAVRAVSRRILNSAGYVVLEAADGQEAMELVADYTGGIDLVLTDVVMPRMGGAELAEKLVERQPDIRVIFMSGYPGEDLPPGLGGGMDGNVMSKPFTAEKLLPRVRQVLDASEG
jgi:CheY-like chemotaxis protein